MALCSECRLETGGYSVHEVHPEWEPGKCSRCAAPLKRDGTSDRYDFDPRGTGEKAE